MGITSKMQPVYAWQRKLYIIKWVWSCGDGCCSDSGMDIKYQDYEFTTHESWLEGSLPAYVASDLIYAFNKNIYDFKGKFFASIGQRYDGPDWCWTRHMDPLKYDQVLKLFKDFGLPLDEIVYSEEER